MKAKSRLLTELLVATGLTLLSLPAGAECWMTCPPGSTATPSSTREQGATATTEQAVSPEERTPAKGELTQGKKPEATAKAASTPAPAKPKAVPAPAGATTEPGAPPEGRTPAKGPKQRPRPRLFRHRRSRRPFQPLLRQVLLRNLHQFSPRRQHQRRRQLRMRWHHRHLRYPLRETQRSSRHRHRQQYRRLCQSQA